MMLQAVGPNPLISSAFGGNPIQTIGALMITVLALHILSNLPAAYAKDPSVGEAVCKKLCEPLPGGENDAPERICVETCNKGTEIIETKTKEALKDGSWTTIEVMGKIATPIAGVLDCTTVCNPLSGYSQEGGILCGAAYEYFTGDKQAATIHAAKAAAKAICTTALFTPAGYNGCLACCGAIKLGGVA